MAETDLSGFHKLYTITIRLICHWLLGKSGLYNLFKGAHLEKRCGLSVLQTIFIVLRLNSHSFALLFIVLVPNLLYNPAL